MDKLVIYVRIAKKSSLENLGMELTEERERWEIGGGLEKERESEGVWNKVMEKKMEEEEDGLERVVSVEVGSHGSVASKGCRRQLPW